MAWSTAGSASGTYHTTTLHTKENECPQSAGEEVFLCCGISQPRAV